VNVSKLPLASAPGDPNLYPVWHAREGNPEKVPPGKYLLSADGQAIVYLVDPGVNGKRTRRDDGTEVPRFEAPKAQLMALITSGILQQKLPWTLVLLGVSIAIVLELCGVSSLAFAVGVYLPLASSTPIFAGGVVRYVAERWGRNRVTPGGNEAESESSPGVLMATGYIAGGAIAGVVIGFLAFSDSISSALATWEYRTYTVSQPQSLKEAAADMARTELGLQGGPESKAQQHAVDVLAEKAEKLNKGLEVLYRKVPAGMVLKLPGERSYLVKKTMTLQEIAEEALGSGDKAALLAGDNAGQLTIPRDVAVLGLLGSADGALLAGSALCPTPAILPAGTELKVPQWTAPALVTFGILTLVLLLVGLGWLLYAPPVAAHPALPPTLRPDEHVTSDHPGPWPGGTPPTSPES
jgi:hypothetical protein